MAKVQLKAGIEFNNGKFEVVMRLSNVGSRNEAEQLAKILSSQFFDYIKIHGGAVRNMRDPALPMIPIIRSRNG